MVATAVVTGANKGIGYEIARQLALRGGVRTVLTARSSERGRAAQEKLRRELTSAGVSGNVDEQLLFHQLDITDADSIQQFICWSKDSLGQVDVLVNNAGFAYKGNVFGAAEAETTIAVNFSGTVAVSEALLAAGVIPDNGGGRIVNVCSGAGKLSIVPDPQLRAEFEHADSTEVLAALGTRFVDAIRRRKHAEEGWPSSMYGVSKLLEAQYSRVLAARLAPRRIAVSACSPGWCATDMSSWGGPRTAAQGAETPVWLALTADSERVSGKFWNKDQEEEPF